MTEDMANNGISYTLAFSDMGMGHLKVGSEKLWVSGMGWKQIAVIDEAGRIATRDPITDERQYADDPLRLRQRTSKTLKLTSQWDLVFTTFAVERCVFKSWLGVTGA